MAFDLVVRTENTISGVFGFLKSSDGVTFTSIPALAAAFPTGDMSDMTRGPGNKLYLIGTRDGVGNGVHSWDGTNLVTLRTDLTPLDLFYDEALDRLYVTALLGSGATVEYFNGSTWTALPGASALGDFDDFLGGFAKASNGDLYTARWRDFSGGSPYWRILRFTGGGWVVDADSETDLGMTDPAQVTYQGVIAREDAILAFGNDGINAADDMAFKRNGSWTNITPGGLAIIGGFRGLRGARLGGDGRVYVCFISDGPRSEIWRYDGSWVEDVDVQANHSSTVFSLFRWSLNGKLYAGFQSGLSGGQFLLRQDSLGSWVEVSLGVSNTRALLTAEFQGSIYTLTSISDCTAGDVRGGDVLRITVIGDTFVAGDVFIVNFDGTDVEATRIDSATLEVVTPPHAAGVVTPTLLRVQANTTVTLPSYTYAVGFPVIYGISPSNGPIAGGTAVTITGANFVAGSTVLFNGLPATNVVVVNSTTITCDTPAHLEGPVDVTIISP